MEPVGNSTPVAPSDMGALEHRVAQRRRRRARAWAAAVVTVVLVAGTVGVVEWMGGHATERTPAIEAPATRPSLTQPSLLQPAITQPSATDAGIPFVTPPSSQVTVPTDRDRAPIAVGNGRVWIGTHGGIAAVDPVSLRSIGTVAIDLPTLVIATSPGAVWVLSGSDRGSTAGDDSDQPWYHLTRIDPVTLDVVFEADLPFHSSVRASRLVRLVSSPGVAWVSFRTTIVRIDAATNSVTTMETPGFWIGDIAADDMGLWMTTNGAASASGVESSGVVRLDRTTGEMQAVPGIPNGYRWSIASSGDAAWLIEYVAPGTADETEGGHLVRIDAATLAVTATRMTAIAVVTGGGEVWVQVTEAATVGKVDPATGAVLRSVDISTSGFPGTSDGYTSPPFAIADGQLWSAFRGLQRTTP
jgi:hypothetical protein